MAEEDNQETINKINETGERFGFVNKILAKFSAQIIKSTKSTEEQFKDLNDELAKNEKATKKATDDDKQKALREKKQDIESAKRRVEYDRILEDSGQALVKATGALTAQLTTSIQDNSGAVAISSKVMSAGMGFVGSASQSAGTALQVLGGGMIAAGVATMGVAAAFGALFYGVGALLNVAGGAATALGKFAVEALSKELEKTIVAFGKASSGGALFADGMTGLRDAAKNAGLTIEQFSQTIQRQSANIAAAGLSVPQGVKRLGNALRAGGAELRGNLINLGFSIAEQGDLVAETMALMRQSGQPLRANGTQIAVQTERYAENLRIIAAITGEDAKRKMAQTREITDQLRFQQKLAGMGEIQSQNIIEGMANIPAALQKNVRDIVLFGNVVNTTGAVMTSLSPNIRGLQNSIAEQVVAGTLTADSARTANKQYMDGIRGDLADENGAFASIALAQSAGLTGIAADTAELSNNLLKDAKKQGEAATTAGEDSVKGQKKTTDELTDNVRDASIAAQKLALALQDSLLTPMGLFADATRGITEGMVKAVDKLYELAGVPNPNKDFGTSTTQNTGMNYGLAGGLKSQPKLNEGGVATGPVSGYAATLHGTEAVVPLPDGKNIPVNLDTSSITTALQHQTATISELLRAQQQSNQLTSQLLSVSV
jgi:hypothetical protein